MAMNEKTVKVYEWFAANQDIKPTVEDAAKALDMSRQAVGGCVLALLKPTVGAVVYDTKPGMGTKEIKFIKITEDGKTYDGELTENCLVVLNYLKENVGVKMTAADIAEVVGLGKKQVEGAVTALGREIVKTERPALVERVPATIEVEIPVKWVRVIGELPAETAAE